VIFRAHYSKNWSSSASFVNISNLWGCEFTSTKISVRENWTHSSQQTRWSQWIIIKTTIKFTINFENFNDMYHFIQT
jgi:hypothetical protein